MLYNDKKLNPAPRKAGTYESGCKVMEYGKKEQRED